jgi:hypothetical protein
VRVVSLGGEPGATAGEPALLVAVEQPGDTAIGLVVGADVARQLRASSLQRSAAAAAARTFKRGFGRSPGTKRSAPVGDAPRQNYVSRRAAPDGFCDDGLSSSAGHGLWM